MKLPGKGGVAVFQHKIGKSQIMKSHQDIEKAQLEVGGLSYVHESPEQEGFVTDGEKCALANEQVLEALYGDSDRASEVNATATERMANVGEISGDEKLYAFASVSSEDSTLGIKGEKSNYYLTEAEVQRLVDQGYLNFDRKLINRDGIRDELALPPRNKMECLVEVQSKNRTAYVETEIGEADTTSTQEWLTGEAYTYEEALHGGGNQVHPDLQTLDRTDANTLPVASWSRDQQVTELADFRDWNDIKTRDRDPDVEQLAREREGFDTHELETDWDQETRANNLTKEERELER